MKFIKESKSKANFWVEIYPHPKHAQFASKEDILNGEYIISKAMNASGVTKKEGSYSDEYHGTQQQVEKFLDALEKLDDYFFIAREHVSEPISEKINIDVEDTTYYDVVGDEETFTKEDIYDALNYSYELEEFKDLDLAKIRGAFSTYFDIPSIGHDKLFKEVLDEIQGNLEEAYNKFEKETDKDYIKSSIDEMERYLRMWDSKSSKEKREIGTKQNLQRDLKYAKQRLSQLTEAKVDLSDPQIQYFYKIVDSARSLEDINEFIRELNNDDYYKQLGDKWFPIMNRAIAKQTKFEWDDKGEVMIKKPFNEDVDIDVENEGILEVPKDKKVNELPTSHFEKLIDKKGYEPIIRALNNLQVWNKNNNKSLSNWAEHMMKKLKDKYRKDEDVKVLSENTIPNGYTKGIVFSSIYDYTDDKFDGFNDNDFDIKKLGESNYMGDTHNYYVVWWHDNRDHSTILDKFDYIDGFENFSFNKINNKLDDYDLLRLTTKYKRDLKNAANRYIKECIHPEVIKEDSGNTYDNSYVVYEMNGEIYGTPSYNYYSKIQDAHLITKYHEFDSAKEAADYLKNTFPNLNVRIEILESLNENIEEASKEKEVINPTPENIDDEGLNSLLNSLIKAEYDTIDEYNSTILAAKDLGRDDIADILTTIAHDENTHVGNLLVATKLINPQTQAIDKGEQQAIDTLEGDVEIKE